MYENPPNGMIEVQVIDNGTGIMKKDFDKMFHLFGFLDSTSELN
jgi:hypothetical protein